MGQTNWTKQVVDQACRPCNQNFYFLCWDIVNVVMRWPISVLTHTSLYVDEGALNKVSMVCYVVYELFNVYFSLRAIYGLVIMSQLFIGCLCYQVRLKGVKLPADQGGNILNGPTRGSIQSNYGVDRTRVEQARIKNRPTRTAQNRLRLIQI